MARAVYCAANHITTRLVGRYMREMEVVFPFYDRLVPQHDYAAYTGCKLCGLSADVATGRQIYCPVALEVED